jgi:lipopolysaccharide export system permease protein
MIGRIDRYIAGEVIKGALVAILVLLTLLTFFSFADELSDLGKGAYSMKKIFTYLLLTLPRNFYELLAPAALVGSLVTLGALANNRELVAMQAAGVSRLRIIGAVLLGGVVLLVLSIIIGEFIAPPSERAAQNLKSIAQNDQVTSRSRYGFWVRDGNVFINIRSIYEKQTLGKINIYDVGENQRLIKATHAKEAVHTGIKWRLKDISTSYFTENHVTTQHEDDADWSSVLAPDLLNAFVIRPENLSVVELLHYLEYLKENGQASQLVEQAFWGRIVNPLVTLVMLMVAVPFVMTVRREVGTGQRIVAGVIIGLGFHLFDKMFGHLGLVYDLNPFFSVAFPGLLALGIVSWILWKTRAA